MAMVYPGVTRVELLAWRCWTEAQLQAVLRPLRHGDLIRVHWVSGETQEGYVVGTSENAWHVAVLCSEVDEPGWLWSLDDTFKTVLSVMVVPRRVRADA